MLACSWAALHGVLPKLLKTEGQKGAFFWRTKSTVFSGDSETLDAAKKAASISVGLAVVAPWKDLRFSLELPDRQSNSLDPST
jgi:hypothetical protein